MMCKLIFCLTFMLTCFVSNLEAKQWRGIVPLKSTRADVERLLGKENQLGRYQFEEERAYIFYSQGPCDNRAGNCKCLIAAGTVLEIYVTLEISRKFSSLQIDRSKLRRKNDIGSIYIYSNLAEGVRYTVDEANDDIVSIDYLPEAGDCEALIKSAAGTQSQVPEKVLPLKSTQKPPAPQRELLKKLTPLHSTRKDVELLLGPSHLATSVDYLYEYDTETISVRYVKYGCDSTEGRWNVAVDTVEELEIVPMNSVTLKDLKFDLSNYRKVELSHPKNVFHYMNFEDGVLIRTRLRGRKEEVTSISFGPASRDGSLQCKRTLP